MLNKFVVCFELTNSERNGVTFMHVLRSIGEHIQLHPGCLMLLSEKTDNEIAEQLSEALRDGDRMAVFNIEGGSVFGLTESQEERFDAFNQKAYESYRTR